jgi:hypothetical protein
MSKESKQDNTEELVDGAMIVIGHSVYFISRDDLRSFRAPKAVAAELQAKLSERPELARGHPNDPILLGVQLSVSGPILQFSSIVEHCLTNSRLH